MPCGEISGYFAHRRHHEAQCPDCLGAMRRHVAGYRKPRPRKPCPGGCGRSIRGGAKACRECHSRSRQPGGRTRRRYLAEAKLEKAAQGTSDPWGFTSGPCNWCGDVFTCRGLGLRFCSPRCKAANSRRLRRAREHGAHGQFTWTQVMGLFLVFDRCCAYCHSTIEGQPDPDHVVPLSRGGANSIHNILPACRACNSDKRDLRLDEWAADRARRGLPPVTTSWPASDRRYLHITSVLPVPSAA